MKVIQFNLREDLAMFIVEYFTAIQLGRGKSRRSVRKVKSGPVFFHRCYGAEIKETGFLTLEVEDDGYASRAALAVKMKAKYPNLAA